MAKANESSKNKEQAAKKTEKPQAGSKAKAAGEKSQKAKQTAASSPQGVVAKVNQFKEFFEESKVEMKKVTYPSRKETVTTSVAVLVLVILMSLFLGVVDLGLSKLVEFILSA